MNKINYVALISFFVIGCTSNSRYELTDDAHPDVHPKNIEQISDATPRYEPFSPQGNATYSVRGKTYQVLANPKSFTQQGFASWYGKKFHGHLTSNGETYDMFAMSAAHKTLPIPCYVRVKNLNNQKEVIVRVNDRGPFHDERIIDLSYAAARKLDIYKTGTAPVEISFIPIAPNKKNPYHLNYYIQIAAGKKIENLQSLAKTIKQKFDVPYRLIQKNGFVKLHVGPFHSWQHAEIVMSKIKNNGYQDSYLIKEDPNVTPNLD